MLHFYAFCPELFTKSCKQEEKNTRRWAARCEWGSELGSWGLAAKGANHYTMPFHVNAFVETGRCKGKEYCFLKIPIAI